MLIILSPSKTQNFKRNLEKIPKGKKPYFILETKKLFSILKNMSSKKISSLMKISKKLADLNFSRFQKWNEKFSKLKIENEEKNFSQSLQAFSGDVYSGFSLEDYFKEDFLFAEKKIRIISGFYGILTPLTFIKPYRLEMGTKISFKIGKESFSNLYGFWSEKISKKINEELKKEKVVLNLASVEYSKVLDRKKINGKIIDVDFLIQKNNQEKIIAIYAKKARGQMANWIIKNRVEKIDDLKKFKNFGWKFSAKKSSKEKLVFVKKI